MKSKNKLKYEYDNLLTEKCAVFGVYGKGFEAGRLSFYGLWTLQHRGQESSGIASSDGKQMYDHNDNGLVDSVYHEKDLEHLKGYMAIGHNRYSTSGGTDKRYNQPFVDKKRRFAFAHNGNLPDYHKLEDFLYKRGVTTATKNDSAMMAAAISCYMDDGLELVEAIKSAFPLFEGAYSIVAMDNTQLVAMRDACGIRPLSIARLEKGYVIASETCAFETIGAKLLRDVKPGEMIVVNDNGLKSYQLVKSNQKLDIFEFVYFARPDSLLLGKRVNDVRKNFGKEMAKEFPIEADVIVAVPDSGIPAALGYSQSSGIKFEIGLVKNRYIHRTFIRPTHQLRERDLKLKLSPVIETLRGQRVILVDDSIVRGSTAKQVVSMLFEAGALEVHLAITSPPVRYPDFYGINTPTQAELIATHMTNQQICDYVGATTLHFLSYKGMIKATGLPAGKFSTSCFNGVYPLPIGKREKELKKLQNFKIEPTSAKRARYPLFAAGSTKSKIAVLASGEGTTAEAFVHAYLNGQVASQIGLVISNRQNAGIIERVSKLNKKYGLSIKCLLINSMNNPPNHDEVVSPGDQTRAEQNAILRAISKENFDLVVLMGYMKRVGPLIIDKFGWTQHRKSVYETKLVNTHPGLLPDSKGLYGIYVQHFVINKKLRYSGQTLHVVAANYDEGPIIAEHHVRVSPTDTAESLNEKVKTTERNRLPIDIDNFIRDRQSYLYNFEHGLYH